MQTLEPDSVDAIVTDPPAGIGFMGKDWDHHKGGRDDWIKWLTGAMREAYRVLKPGAHGLVWALPRTSHWTATALEDAGFEVRDVVMHLFGSGFPKSLDVSKAIDKAAGAEREILGVDPARFGRLKNQLSGSTSTGENWEHGKRDANITAPATWQGWGTALKPASEHWILIRKPCSEKTVAANVLKHGTGGININASRVEMKPGDADLRVVNPARSGVANGTPTNVRHAEMRSTPHMQGRFPANLVLSHSPGCVEIGTNYIKGGSGWSRSGSKESNNTAMSGKNYARKAKPDGYADADGTETVAAWECEDGCAVKALDGQSGTLKSGELKGYKSGGGSANGHLAGKAGASRFFYVAKASKSDKGEGNTHPTVKSTKLMSYLIRLITPPDGVVLDPFMGSGSTGVAALAAGFRFIGIDKEPAYFEIAERRLTPATIDDLIGVT